MKTDKMKLNDSKTEFLIIVTRSTAEQSLHYFDKLSVGDSTIKPSASWKSQRRDSVATHQLRDIFAVAPILFNSCNARRFPNC